MTTFTVTNLNDSGEGSLRAAIEASNAAPPNVPNTIEFSVSGTILLASDLPHVTNTVSIIAGDTATGNAPTVGIDFNQHAGLVFEPGSAGSQLIGLSLGNADGDGVTLSAGSILLNNNYIGLALDGTALGNSGDGISIAATSSANLIGYNPDAAALAAAGSPSAGVISNVISANGGNGISLHGSADNVVVSNRIGTSVDGNTSMGNGGNGIWLTDGSNGNTIGGTVVGNDAAGDPNDPTGDKGTVTPIFVAPPLGNLVSGNGQNGVLIDEQSQNNLLNGNYIGTTADGNTALGNQGDGVAIINADFNSLHGCTVVDNPFIYYNVVSGNAGNGIHVTDSDHVTIRANFVGIGANNAVMVGNAGDGILIDGSSRNTQVGGVIPLGNVVSGNALNGIEVTDTASGFSTLNTFAGIYAFVGIAPNGNNGILITSTGGNQTVQTNVISGNLNNGLEISGDAWGVTVVPNIIGLDTRGDTAFANGNNGILIAGTAHDNVVGGTGILSNASVIRQNTISGNNNYGIVISEQAHNNVISQSAIGTDIQELAALPNGAGGVLLQSTGIGNVVGTAHVGWSPLPSPAELVNVISGNIGNGVTLDAGVDLNAVIRNWIGLNLNGQSTLPNGGNAIVDGGTYNLIYGNQTVAPTPLPLESPTSQLEALYIGWFGRAADPLGFDDQMGQLLTLITDGVSLAAAMLIISEGFATSPENAQFAALAAQTVPVVTPSLLLIELTNNFINQTFTNLFDRAADSAELAAWRTVFFSGAVPYADLVYDIALSALNDDVTAMNSKIQAAAYFTSAMTGLAEVPSLAEMQAAVSDIFDATTEYTSQAATDAQVGSSHVQIDYQTILSPLDIITGVRADLEGAVILTGSRGTSGSTSTQAFLFQGPLNDTAAGTVYLLDPDFGSGQTVTTATLYGPNTSIFAPSIGLGNVRAVGSYQYSESPTGIFNHGMIYEGRVDGTNGTWTQIDVPSDGVDVTDGIVIGTAVRDTILHSTAGELVVGNYDLVGPGGTLLGANGFIYNMVTQQYTLMNVNGSFDNLTSLYGIWQNGVGSTSYTLAGGTKDAAGLNAGFLAHYDLSTGLVSDLSYYTGNNAPGVITHFENITAVPGGYNLVATTDAGPAFVFIELKPDGTFGEAVWTAADLPGSNLMTGNIVYQNVFGGIYNTDSGDDVGSYLGVVDQSHVSAEGGLIMPVGSFDFAYSLNVAGSVGVSITGSAVAGNVLGGSIGNDTLIGTQSLVQPDTIYTGGGTDVIVLAAAHTARTRIELFAGNGLTNIAAVAPGFAMDAVAGSIVDAENTPQLGWWGQATGQFGGPVSDDSTNAGLGSGTSQNMSVVLNFTTGTANDPGDVIDIALDAFSDYVRDASGASPMPGYAVFSNLLESGGVITVTNANVLLIDSPIGFANAAELAAELWVNPISFAGPQSGEFNHFIIAYADLEGDVRIADMDIQLGNTPTFNTTAQGATLSISDMVELRGVSLSSLQTANINFLGDGHAEIANSSYLDFTGYRITDGTTVAAAYHLDSRNVQLATRAGINVAIILDRVEDPSALLGGSWGERQRALADLNDSGTLWSTYGADQAQYNAVVSVLQNTYNLRVLDGTDSAIHGDYVSSAASRTIWVEVDTAAQFANLFDTPLYVNNDASNPFVFWNGNLALPEEWNVQGLWFDTENAPPASNMAPGGAVSLTQGPQSIGNATASVPNMAPNDIAALYHFPLDGQSVQTGSIALIAPGTGNVVPNDGGGTFDQRLAQYLASIGQTGNGAVFVQGLNGQSYVAGDPGERSTDVGTFAAINPNSDIGLYNGSGFNGNASASTFTALQSAIWDQVNNPGVISNASHDLQSMSPNSPFYRAYSELYVDAALRNQTVLSALGDGGSGNGTGNGLANVSFDLTSPYALLVGGTSKSTLAAAAGDPTLFSSFVEPALAGDLSTIWQLMANGLTRLPSNATAAQAFVETAWNSYVVNGGAITSSEASPGGYVRGTAGAGGVDPTQPTPSYQAAYGLSPVTADPMAQSGRGVPDVSGNAGGNLHYLVPGNDMLGATGQHGTGPAAAFWGALTTQFNLIFEDQGLPRLGYMNDLLYIASVIAPAAFADVTLGNNISSFVEGRGYSTADTAGTGQVEVTPTGHGYYAGPGYDLVSGLGTPNGTLLARALTAIGHSEMYFSESPDMLDAAGDGWTSGANQSLLFQAMSAESATIDVSLGSQLQTVSSGPLGAYAWTSRLAQQSLQADFDPVLVRMFDQYAQGAVMQSQVSSGEDVSVSINASMGDAIQGSLSSAFGFADFLTDSGAVRVARAVAAAETAGGLDDQIATVRVRQNGTDNLSLSLYRVDDLGGMIDGLSPGSAGYADAAQTRAYQFADRTTSLDGPGYGEYTQAALVGIDAGDLIAMRLTTTDETYWAFAQANETVDGQQVGHIWNYGLNTWGWEDQKGGGDRDFNDLVVQLDFNSAAGHGWLV
ncbi:DUF4114 domain-containing protein [Neoroseomonas lacus]|uniref:Peptidase S53 domain-containing protein n=1 Tax=Neoroseomonas lacus TaxID=287609 RepID=A0A917L175_9PROT|nr:DUF4114 domain-containing protein [Neoroseomonas lacus]GGJ35556.1 hypothetical protein GCM10011320_49130 [Neoroseomonas lacus]